MPIYESSLITGPTQFDGLTPATGLFDAAAHTGSRSIQVGVNSLTLMGTFSLTTWTISRVDPSDDLEGVILSGTVFPAAGASFELLPTNDDGSPWRLKFVTTGFTGSAKLKIDFDFEATPG